MKGTIASPIYSAALAPSDPTALPAYLNAEFEKIQRAILLLGKGHIDTSYAAPAKPRDGDIRLADGVHWNPIAAGAPRFVGYRGGAWVLLG